VPRPMRLRLPRQASGREGGVGLLPGVARFYKVFPPLTMALSGAGL